MGAHRGHNVQSLALTFMAYLQVADDRAEDRQQGDERQAAADDDQGGQPSRQAAPTPGGLHSRRQGQAGSGAERACCWVAEGL